MATRAEANLRVNVQDGYSKPLDRLQNGMNRFNASLNRLNGAGMNAYAQSLQNIDNNIKSINKTTSTYMNTLAKISAMYKAIGTLGNAFSGAFSGFFNYYKSFETNAVGISGILSSMITLNGKTLEWNESMSISKDIMTKLRIQALQTAATSEDLIETFRALLGPGLSGGMSIDEVMRFSTVGVNAVKSLGLPTNQLIQELRDLVQGGIRAASSTLATALGLKDADITAAKNSAEGLFRFLMKRMEGFAKSTDETAKTLQGQIEILKEGFLSLGASAGEEIFQGITDAIAKINGMLLTKNGKTGLFEVNPEMVTAAKNVADTIAWVIDKLSNFSGNFLSNWGTIFASGSVIWGLPKLLHSMTSSMESFKEKANGLVASFTMQRDIQAEINEDARTRIRLLENEFSNKRIIVEQDKQIAELNKQISAQMPYGTMGWNFDSYISKLEKLGFSSTEARNKIVNMLREIQKGTQFSQEHALALQKEIDALIRDAEATERDANAKIGWREKTKQCLNVMAQFSSALSGCAMGVMMLTDADNEFAQSLTKVLFGMDAVITGFANINEAIRVSITWWATLDATVKTVLGRLLMAVPLAMGAAAAIYSASKGGGQTDADVNDNDISDMLNPDGSLKSNAEIMQAAKISKQIQTDIEKSKWERLADEWKKNTDNDNYAGNVLLNNVGMRFPKSDAAKASGNKSSVDKAAENLEKALKKYESLLDKLDVDIKKSSLYYSSLDEAKANIVKQENAWNEEIKTLKEKGVEQAKIDELNLLKETAVKERYLAAERNWQKKLNELRLSSAGNVMLFGGTQADQYKATDEALQNQRKYYETLLADENLAKDRRIEIENEYASVVQKIRENNLLNYKTSWTAALEEITMKQINYGESIKNVFSTIESAGVSLLSSTESFGSKIKTFFTDVTNSILQEMAKIIMKGLITNAVLSIFNLGGSWSKYSTSGNLDPMKVTGMNIPKKASGGMANGWTIVGEQGPELVNFSSPGRVYTADQTSKALGGGNVNIKIDLRNESGQQLKAETTGSTFDGDSYIVGVVLKAISTNRGGLRTVLRGV